MQLLHATIFYTTIGYQSPVIFRFHRSLQSFPASLNEINEMFRAKGNNRIKTCKRACIALASSELLIQSFDKELSHLLCHIQQAPTWDFQLRRDVSPGKAPAP